MLCSPSRQNQLLLHARRATLVVMLATLPVACSDQPSAAELERLITHDARFTTPKTWRVPRRMILASRYGTTHGALHLTDQDWASVDWVTHALDRNHFVKVVDNATPMASSSPRIVADTSPTWDTMKNESYEHYIDVSLTTEAERSGDFTEDDDDPEPGYANLPSSRTPGWRLAIARRKFERVVQVLDNSATTETVLPGNAVAYFEFRWMPTATGALFDQGGDAITQLDQMSWSNARQLFRFDSRLPQRAKVYLNRVEKGHWIVKGMECGKCGWFNDQP